MQIKYLQQHAKAVYRPLLTASNDQEGMQQTACNKCQLQTNVSHPKSIQMFVCKKQKFVIHLFQANFRSKTA